MPASTYIIFYEMLVTRLCFIALGVLIATLTSQQPVICHPPRQEVVVYTSLRLKAINDNKRCTLHHSVSRRLLELDIHVARPQKHTRRSKRGGKKNRIKLLTRERQNPPGSMDEWVATKTI